MKAMRKGFPYLRAMLSFLPQKLLHRSAAGRKVGQPHLGVFAGEDDARRAGFEGGGGRVEDVLRLGLFLISAGWDVDVDAGKDSALSAFSRTFRGEGTVPFCSDDFTKGDSPRRFSTPSIARRVSRAT